MLLEMQSAPDFTMPFRLLQYISNLLANEFKNTPENIRESKAFRLPAIVPITLYNGEEKWNVVRSFKEYTSNYGEFGNNIINFEYLLFDLNQFNREDILETHKLLDFVFTMDLNHSSRSAANFINEYQKLAALKHDLTDDDIKTFVSWFVHVILKGNVDENFEKEAAAAFRKGDSKIMTYAFDRLVERERGIAEKMGEEKGIKKGIKKGVKKGKYEQTIAIARNLLRMNTPFEQITLATGLPYEEIERLK